MAIREFGEFGGVNSSIECSTTFTGGFGAAGQAKPLSDCCLHLPDVTIWCGRVALARPAVLDPATLQDIFKGQKGPQQGGCACNAAAGRFRRNKP